MRVAVLDDYQQVASSLADWALLDADVEFFKDHLDQERLISRLQGFDVVVAMRERTPFPRSVLEGLPDLRLLVTTGRANASIDLDAATDHGVVVSGTGGLVHPTAELTFALILALARGLIPEVDFVRRGGWQLGLGQDLSGSTLGLLGLGHLGSRVATFGLTFGMNVVAWSQNLTVERAKEVGVNRVAKERLLSISDFVSVHLSLSDRTRGLIQGRDLALMMPSAFLINTSRGPIVDERGLLDAVQSGTIAGAAIDVFDDEPLAIDHPFRSDPRILVTPHLGYVTRQNYEVFYGEAVESIMAWVNGAPIRLLTS